MLQVYAAAIQSHVNVSGTTCMAMLRALHIVGEWKLAEAALLCALPTPPLLAHAVALYQTSSPLPEHSTLRILRALSQGHVDPTAAMTDSEGTAADTSGTVPRTCMFSWAVLCCAVLRCAVLCCAVL